MVRGLLTQQQANARGTFPFSFQEKKQANGVCIGIGIQAQNIPIAKPRDTLCLFRCHALGCEMNRVSQPAFSPSSRLREGMSFLKKRLAIHRRRLTAPRNPRHTLERHISQNSGVRSMGEDMDRGTSQSGGLNTRKSKIPQSVFFGRSGGLLDFRRKLGFV